jgi:hypothetical protein
MSPDFRQGKLREIRIGNFGIWVLGFVWNLVFGIWNLSGTSKRQMLINFQTKILCRFKNIPTFALLFSNQ